MNDAQGVCLAQRATDLRENAVGARQEVIDRIVACSYDPLAGGHHLSGGDKKRIAFRLATRYGAFASAEKLPSSASSR